MVLARTDRRELPRFKSLGAQREYRADDLGDDVTRLADDHRVAGTNVLQLDLVLVVQGRHRDRGPGDQYRLEHRERRHLSRAADRDLDVVQHRRSLLGRELVRDRPAGRLGGDPECRLHGQIVDLHHDPVDLVPEIVTMLGPVRAEVVDLLERTHHSRVRIGRQPQSRHPLERPGVGRKFGTADHFAELVTPEGQAPTGGDRRVLLAQRTRSRVARVGVEPTPCGLLGGIERRERVEWQVDLAPDLDHLGRAVQ